MRLLSHIQVLVVDNSSPFIGNLNFRAIWWKSLPDNTCTINSSGLILSQFGTDLHNPEASIHSRFCACPTIHGSCFDIIVFPYQAIIGG
jgi:hypothetical protein